MAYACHGQQRQREWLPCPVVCKYRSREFELSREIQKYRSVDYHSISLSRKEPLGFYGKSLTVAFDRNFRPSASLQCVG